MKIVGLRGWKKICKTTRTCEVGNFGSLQARRTFLLQYKRETGLIGSIIFGVGDKKLAPFLRKKIETNDKL